MSDMGLDHFLNSMCDKGTHVKSPTEMLRHQWYK